MRSFRLDGGSITAPQDWSADLDGARPGGVVRRRLQRRAAGRRQQRVDLQGRPDPLGLGHTTKGPSALLCGIGMSHARRMESRRSLPTIFLFTVVVVACSASRGPRPRRSARNGRHRSSRRHHQASRCSMCERPPSSTAATSAEAINVDYLSADFRGRMAGFDRTLPYVMYCRSGNRSADARAVMADSPLRWSTQTHPSDRRTGVSERRMTSVSHGQVPSRGRLGGAPSERPMGSGSHRGGC